MGYNCIFLVDTANWRGYAPVEDFEDEPEVNEPRVCDIAY
jgi:hypothetical protein